MKKHLILCAVDYSDSTEPAIRIATDLAQVNKSKIILLSVTDPKAPKPSMQDMQIKRITDRLRDHDIAHKDIEFENVNLRGNPSEVLVEYAKKHSVDLIVMGTHGRTGLAKMVVGSVSQGVMARASCPVVIVKLPAQADSKASRNSLTL
jgi:universal stress protein A